MIDLQDYRDVPDHLELSQRTSVARKEHECGICKKPIHVGQQYERYVYMFDGKFEMLKTHLGWCAGVE